MKKAAFFDTFREIFKEVIGGQKEAINRMAEFVDTICSTMETSSLFHVNFFVFLKVSMQED